MGDGTVGCNFFICGQSQNCLVVLRNGKYYICSINHGLCKGVSISLNFNVPFISIPAVNFDMGILQLLPWSTSHCVQPFHQPNFPSRRHKNLEIHKVGACCSQFHAK